MGSSAQARRRTLAVLAVYAALLAVAFLSPTSVRQSEMANWIAHGVVNPDHAELLGNVLIIAPITALGSLAWPRTTWRTWTAYAAAVSSAVELVQALLLPARTGSVGDVLANTLGGLAGALIVAAARRVSRRRTAAGTPPTHPAGRRPDPGRPS